MRVTHRTMSRSLRRIALLAVLVSACDDSPTGTSNGAQSENEVRAASLAWDQAYNSGNVTEIMDLYHDEAVSIPPGLPALSGKQALRADFEGFFAAYTATHQTTILELEITGDLAVERATYTWSANARDGSGGFGEAGRHIVIRKRVNGSWLVLWEIWNTN